MSTGTENNSDFYNFLAEGNIICHSEQTVSADVIAELAHLLARNTAGIQPGMVISRVLEREEVMPTIIAPGLAVPHAKMPELNQMLVAMATSEHGIAFPGDDGVPVKVVVLVLTPEQDPGLHLQVLAALAKEFGKLNRIAEVAILENAHAVMQFFSKAEVEISPFLKAGDVMKKNFITLKETDTLRTAIETFAKNGIEDIPVMDDDGDLRGLISLSDILKFSLPEHILWMDNLAPIYRFQPFAEVLETADETKLADIMREEFLKVDADVPAIQLAKLFLIHNVRRLVVVNSGGKLAGIVELKDFCANLFWE